MTEIWNLLAKGGWLVYPILFGSIVGMALFVERLWALRKSRINPPGLFRRLLLLIGNGQIAEARMICQGENNALSRIMVSALSQDLDADKAQIRESVEEVGQREAFFMERYVGALGVVASIEPLLGLLGTVLGMIKAFQKVESAGVGDPRVVAAGVWAALLTTAFGLLVAIPAYIAYRFLLAKVDRAVLDLQSEVSLLLDALFKFQRTRQKQAGTAQVTHGAAPVTQNVQQAPPAAYPQPNAQQPAAVQPSAPQQVAPIQQQPVAPQQVQPEAAHRPRRPAPLPMQEQGEQMVQQGGYVDPNVQPQGGYVPHDGYDGGEKG